MLDAYRSAPNEYKPYILRARHIRAEAFRTALGTVAGPILAWFGRGFRKLKCRHIQRRAEQKLRSLSSTVLKDIGVSSGEIPWRVREALPCA